MKAREPKLKPLPIKSGPAIVHRMLVPYQLSKEYERKVDLISSRQDAERNGTWLVFHVKQEAEGWGFPIQTMRIFRCHQCGKLNEFLWEPNVKCPKCLSPRLTLWRRLVAWWRARKPRARAQIPTQGFDFKPSAGKITEGQEPSLRG